jgi:hypothetical protein
MKKYSALTYGGVCPNCLTNEDETYWLKTADTTSQYYCRSCRLGFEVEFNFNILDEKETKDRLDDLNRGVIIFQHIPNMISGVRAEEVHVYNYEEMLEVPWIGRFKKTTVVGGQ